MGHSQILQKPTQTFTHQGQQANTQRIDTVAHRTPQGVLIRHRLQLNKETYYRKRKIKDKPIVPQPQDAHTQRLSR